jgi:hypothetical protein
MDMIPKEQTKEKADKLDFIKFNSFCQMQWGTWEAEAERLLELRSSRTC